MVSLSILLLWGGKVCKMVMFLFKFRLIGRSVIFTSRVQENDLIFFCPHIPKVTLFRAVAHMFNLVIWRLHPHTLMQISVRNTTIFTKPNFIVVSHGPRHRQRTSMLRTDSPNTKKPSQPSLPVCGI